MDQPKGLRKDRDLQDEEEDDDDDDGALGNLFFGSTTFCHKRWGGWFGFDNEFVTTRVWQILEFLHYGHGDEPGTCASACPTVCGHQECYDDYRISDSGDSCECFPGTQARLCGDNTLCRDEECECMSGYVGDPNVRCVNQNECAIGDLNDCGPNTVCVDEPGSFRCECKTGYSGDPTSTEGCVDDQECTDDPGRCGRGECINTPGAYRCECEDGFEASDGQCVNIDECQRLEDPCGPNSECSDSQGSYSCSCSDGYAVEPETDPSPSNQCQDVQECTVNPSICGDNAMCTNTVGSYTCECEQGYEGNPCVPNACTNIGLECGILSICDTSTGTPECSCDEGFEGDPNVECREIDECALGTDNCNEDQNCFNRPPGSFTCLIKEFRECPQLGNDEPCTDGMQCAKTSRSDSTPVCCPETGLCEDGSTECCNGAYVRGEECPSRSPSDCEGELGCGRTLFDDTYRCCLRTSFDDIFNFESCQAL